MRIHTLIAAAMPSLLACALQKAEHRFRHQLGLLLLNKVPTVLNVDGVHIDRLLSNDHVHPLVGGTTHHENGHVQLAILLVVTDVLREGLIPCVACADRVGAVERAAAAIIDVDAAWRAKRNVSRPRGERVGGVGQ